MRSSDEVFTDLQVSEGFQKVPSNSGLQEECLFSIIYGDNYETLDLIASSGDDANIWVTGLMALTSNKCRFIWSTLKINSGRFSDECKPSSSQFATLRERWIESVFDEFDTKKNGHLDEQTAFKAILHINSRISHHRLTNKLKVNGFTLEKMEP